MNELEKRIIAAKREIRARSFDGIQRIHVCQAAEFRAADDGGYSIVGHGAVFNSLSENLGGFREKIDPGSFGSVLSKSPDVRDLFNHDQNLILAATRNETLHLEEDATGLRYVADVTPAIAATYYGEAMRAQLAEGLVTQSSFAFRVGNDTWDEDPDTGGLIRTIHDFSALYDVSQVVYPAYPAADSGISRTAHVGERVGDDPSAGERTVDGADVDEQAEHDGYRLALRRRRLNLRISAE